MNKILKLKYQLLLFFLLSFLFLTNYKPGTYLLGWDNLQTELNPTLGVYRAIFSVWEEYQSFGLLAGMAHAADLVRALFIVFLSFILPQNLVRYVYHCLMLFLGGVGMLTLLGKRKAAFLGALFYILNLGTIQIFYLPFEPFSTFFAFLPWGIWSFRKLINNPPKADALRRTGVQCKTSQRDLCLFFLINLLGTPSFYTQQLFAVYLLILGLISLGKIFKDVSTPLRFAQNLKQNKKQEETSSLFPQLLKQVSWKNLKTIVIAFVLIFIVNSFWILPQLYFVKTSSSVIYNAKINQLATEDVYFQNREKGTPNYFLRLEGYYYDLFDKNNQYLFLPWKKHFETFYPLQYLFAFLMILGLIIAVKQKKWEFIFPFVLIVIVFLNATWPIDLLDQTIRSNRLLNQIFRSAFTKFIIPYSFFASYFMFLAIVFIENVIKKLIQRKTFITLFYLTIFLFIFIYALPAFSGNYFAAEMKVTIPKEYLSLIDYFKKEDKNKRIALFPEYTFWGWYITRWGLNGSGFLWYGIEQPIVSRTFDVWSEKSEGYFWEIKSAIEAEDIKRFDSILEKYDIDYLVLDYSLLPVVGSMKGLSYQRLNNLIHLNSKIKPIKKWGNLALFQYNREKNLENFVAFKSNLLNISPPIRLTDYDTAYLGYNNYLTDKNSPAHVVFPFLDLMTQTKINQKSWAIKEKSNTFEIEFDGNATLNDYQLENFNRNFSAQMYIDEKVASYSGKLNPQIEKNKLKIAFDKVLIATLTEKDFTKTDCFIKTTCYSYLLPSLPQKHSYILKINTKNENGRRLFFYVLDQTKKQAFLEDRLKNDAAFYILPPKYQYGLGYSLTFHENNYDNVTSKNKIVSAEVYLFPYENLKSLYLLSTKPVNNQNQNKIVSNDFEVVKKNYALYHIKVASEDVKTLPQIIYLSQSFHPGWKLYQVQPSNIGIQNWINTYFPFLFGKEIKEHVIVNNWANGWQLPTTPYPPEPQFIAIFWPQYLEFIGFGLLVVGLLSISCFRKKSH
jgi:hypothetical protein